MDSQESPSKRVRFNLPKEGDWEEEMAHSKQVACKNGQSGLLLATLHTLGTKLKPKKQVREPLEGQALRWYSKQ